MAKENLSIKLSYQEQINLLSNENAGILFKALFAYKNNNELPKMDCVTNMLFSIFRQDLDAEMQKNERITEIRAVAGKKGNLAKQANAKFAKNDLAKVSKTSKCEKRESTFSLKERSKEKDTLFVKENTPLNPPKVSGESQKLFFERYGQFKRYANGEYPGIDFKRLFEEFEKSTILRKTISWKIIQDGYANILSGAFRDRENTNKGTDTMAEINKGREIIAERERYYSALRDAEIGRVERLMQKFKGFKEFATLDKKIREMPIKLAKAECEKDKIKLDLLFNEERELNDKIRAFVESKGYRMEDFKIRETCLKCHDTGFTDSGNLCDCYKGKIKDEMGKAV